MIPIRELCWWGVLEKKKKKKSRFSDTWVYKNSDNLKYFKNICSGSEGEGKTYINVED